MSQNSADMLDALRQLAEMRGISVEVLFDALANALETAYKRLPDAHEYAWVTIDPDTFDESPTADDVEMLGDTVTAAVNDALNKARDAQAAALGPLAGNLPL